MEFPDQRLLIFAKAPAVGQVKQRLIPALGAQRATDLYVQMARYCMQEITASALCPVELWCCPSTDHPFFTQCVVEHPVSLYRQSGADLGERMAHAVASVLQRANSAVIIGTDCPAMTIGDLRQCMVWLRDGMDVVIGPAEDSGYCLIGVRRMIKELFADIPWGGSRVLPLTRQRIAEYRLKSRELTTRWDVDRPEDVERLQRLGLLTMGTGLNAN